MRIACVIGLLGVLAGSAHAAKATYSVEITPPSWRADAIAAALRADLADERLQLAVAVPQVTVRGELLGATLRYAIAYHDRRAAGVLALGGGRKQLAGELRDALHRIVKPPDEDVQPGAPATVGEPELGSAWLVLTVLAAVLAAPLVLGGVLLGAVARKLRAFPRLALALAGVVVAAYTLATEADRIAGAAWAVHGAGGLAWGAFGAIVLPVALPPLLGLHRVEHHELVRVLGTWLALALQRTLALALVLVPIGIAIAALDLSPAIAFGVVAPAVGLAGVLAWRGVVDVLAARLDARLVDGDATTEQPWHPQVRAYFTGYLRRANINVDEQLLERVRFLPGQRDEVAVYGGGFTHTRIVIGRAMLEHALAPYGRPHDYAMPRVSTLHWTHWNAGLVMPTEPGAKLATREERQPHSTVDDGEHERIALGEVPTFSGIVEPSALDPRTTYRPSEDPLWLDWDPGEEYDGTDAGDKDYLFGALVHAMGAIQRREDRAQTLALALRDTRLARAGVVIRPLRAFAARQTAALGDVYAALGGARHHLAQYLAWRAWHREDLVTARAHAPELAAKSRAIEAALGADSAADRKPELGRDARQREALRDVVRLERRLAALELFVAGRGAPTRRRRLVFAAAVLVGLAAVAALIIQAFAYHPTYEERIEAQSRDHGQRS